MITDVHAHYLPPEYVQRLASLSSGPPRGTPPRSNELTEVERRLEMMDDAGVIRQVLSPMTGPYMEDESKAAEAAKVLNDCYAELIAKQLHPGAGFKFSSTCLQASLTQDLSQRCSCPGDPGFYGADRHAAGRGDLAVAPVFDVGQDHGYPLGPWQLRKGPFQDLAGLGGEGGRLGRRLR